MSLDCTHCVDCTKNAIGEKIAYCELWNGWKNISLGDCFGNCESQERFIEWLELESEVQDEES